MLHNIARNFRSEIQFPRFSEIFVRALNLISSMAENLSTERSQTPFDRVPLLCCVALAFKHALSYVFVCGGVTMNDDDYSKLAKFKIWRLLCCVVLDNKAGGNVVRLMGRWRQKFQYSNLKTTFLYNFHIDSVVK